MTEAFEFLRPSDTLVIWKLSRLGRSMKHMIEIPAFRLTEKNTVPIAVPQATPSKSRRA